MESKNELPLISCICVTKDRPDFLLRSIQMFEKQNYPSKELVISYPENDQRTIDAIKYILESKNVKIIQIQRLENDSIGKSRNSAIANCHGEYVCIWDDDDINYPTRLSEQYNTMFIENKFDSSILTRIILYEATAQKAFLSYSSYWISTLLCLRDHLLNYPCADSNEFELAPILNFLVDKNQIFYIQNNPSLYTYVYHGRNYLKYTIFLALVNKSEPLPEEFAKEINFFLSQKITF